MNKQPDDVSGKSETTTDIINRIPNGIHLHTIRAALSKGQASVMVGSGFSLNAQGGHRLPVWDQLIDKLLVDLYPTAMARKKEKERLGGISGMLRLAEEYAAVRGRVQLDTRLHELLPDAGVVMPGDLHTKLLSLYWNDVFTTNYDTLLERALDTDRGRFNPRIKPRYQVVIAAHDVPFSKRNGRPRVVKLHGSLRGGTRLIVTEEDYRCYPTDFAPFVNTVQQSMLENVFCLIGFSGDDPNFLLWTGWARDHLGDKAPPVYLITLSHVSEGQRILLEKRNIFPINIAELGQNKGRVDYAKALNALLDFWHEEPPVRRAKWPFHNPGSVLKSYKPDVSQLTEWIRVAQRNRKEYPGWLVAPADNRIRLRNSSSHWIVWRAFKANANSMPQWLKLVFLDEITWIFDIAMMPLHPELANFIALEFADAVKIDKQSPPPLIPDSAQLLRPGDDDIRLINARLALAMLRDAREDDNNEDFVKWVSQLNEFPADRLPSDLQCALLHEQVLFRLEHRDKHSAIDLLNALEACASGADPYWRIRTGALLGEVGVVRRAYELVRSGLHAIRDAIQFEGESAYLVSREQWSERLLRVLDVAVKDDDDDRLVVPVSSVENEPTTWSTEPGLRTRIAVEEKKVSSKAQEDKVERDENALDNIEHPNFLMEAIRNELDIAESMLNAGATNIDAEILSDDKRSPNLRPEASNAAVTYIRLIERVSLPPSVGNVRFTAEEMATCYRILSLTVDPMSSMRILSRAGGGATLGSAESFELPAIAAMTSEKAREVFRHSVEVINALTNDLSWDKRAAYSLKFLLDLASRVAFRLEPSHASILCGLAIRLYALPALREDNSLHRPFELFFTRAIRLLPAEQLESLCPTLLSLSARDINFFYRRSWPDVVNMLRNMPIALQAGRQWIEVVDQVMDEVQSLSPSERSDEELSGCFKRLDWLHREGLMTVPQQHRFAKLIWQNAGPNGLPQIPNFYTGAVLTWPSLSGSAALAGTFRRWLETQKMEPIENLTDVMGELQRTLSQSREELLSDLLLTKSNNVSFDWPEHELLSAIEKLRSWWLDEGRRLTEPSRISTHEYVTPRLRLIAHVIHRVFSSTLSLKNIQAQRLDEWFEELWNCSVSLNTPLVSLLFAGLRWWPERTMDVVDLTISVIGANQSRSVSSAALNAAAFWLLEIESPTESSRRFVNYLVDSIRSGPEFQLELKLNTIAELLENGGQRHLQAHLRSLSVTLCMMIRDLQNSGESLRGGLNNYATPLLRAAIVRVLMAIGKNLKGASREPTWISAVEMARQDSLLLVRKLVS
ncbi:SIR2-like domain-containing protein [Collimonas sp. OK307]|uniref:SIR2 family NAD-dependent protein deacylase n=1 Tax=Collimonas sp. OK307 TaxID=1801620 RepID=UPI0008EA7E6B|nr:SIR2 family protein [Collimonas sp. OK307]SFI02941.1 SIR2-like domain-containing protein [Collimonas sp. OK307]